MRPSLLLSALLLSGCVSYWTGQDMQADVAALQGQIEQINEQARKDRETTAKALQKLTANLAAMETRFEEAIDQIRTNIADKGAEFDEMRTELNQLRGVIEKTQKDLEEKAKDDGLPKVEAGAGAPKLPDTAAELYRYGWERKGAEDCNEAIRAFATFVRKYKGNDRADNSLYLMAECQYVRQEYTQSIRTLQQIIQKYAKGDKVDDALVMMHDNFVALGRCKDALPFLETLLADYPRSNRVKTARRKLRKTKRRCKKKKR